MSERSTAEKSRTAETGKGGIPPSRKFLLAALFLGLLLIAAGVVYLCIAVPKAFLTENPRFRIRHIQVEGVGYWQAHPEELAMEIGLRRDGNLFLLKPAELRQKLLRIQNIESAAVRIVLPDTVILQLTERIPRALLGSPSSPIVLDENGISMKRSQTIAVRQNLPVIKELRRDAGDVSKQLLPALQLIMVALNDFPDIKIYEISLAEKNALKAKLIYREWKYCTVYFPDEGDYHYLLSALQSAILADSWQGNNRSNFDLRNKGQVVIR